MKPHYTIKFYMDGQVMCMKEYSSGKANFARPDFGLFGHYIAKSNLLTKSEKKSFKLFCSAYLEEVEKESHDK